ncbi:MAG TPA: PEP/pyruvate-binding domain-containing protein, partial [Gemmataceae bacterium]|nr:PEP/pyruvate-binding domain-containing protein [Gemmataceae bacterium]
TDAVGGKGQSLGVLSRAGLPVPPGFCITSAAYRRLAGRSLQDEPELAAAIADAYRRLGGGAVAVRSSATAEDGAVTSFAGQQETVLGVTGEAALLDAVGRCWQSLHSERAVAYRRHQGIDDRGLAMAVVVQRFVPAEVAGVLFTRDPLDAEGRRMLVEASWGVGEVVVSGQVTPDRYHLDRTTGAVLDRHVAAKAKRWSPEGPQPVPAAMQLQPCLDDARLAELAALARRVEEVCGGPRDVEWAWADGRFWLLQARPITAGGADERRQVWQEEVESLRAKARPGGTVWARYNLAEILPEPTPMTWAVVRRFMSGRGGFGLMYRDLGFDIAPSLDDEGIYDLVCGRPYCNLSREPLLQFRRMPLGYSFADLKANPHKALYPQQMAFDPGRATWRFWLGLPLLVPAFVVGGIRRQLRLNALARTFADHLRTQVFPAFAAETAEEATHDLSDMDGPALVERLEQWIRRTLYDFARDSLKPTVLAAVAMENLRAGLSRSLGAEAARAAVNELAMGARPDAEADLTVALDDLAAGKLERSAFLARFGHRGRQEMELSRPRWAEDPAAVDRLLAGRATPTPARSASEGTAAWERIADQAKLTGPLRTALETELRNLHTYLGLRETGKHYLLRGYALIRRILVELDRRHGLGGGVFFLTPEELPRLVKGEDLSGLIAQRRRRRSVALSLEVPQVLFSDDLDAIGRPAPVAAADTWQGVPLSVGVAEAPALVLEEPTADVPAEPYILVCPTTDPDWVPLFTNARGLVMETGGVLSHGAIVARE